MSRDAMKELRSILYFDYLEAERTAGGLKDVMAAAAASIRAKTLFQVLRAVDFAAEGGRAQTTFQALVKSPVDGHPELVRFCAVPMDFDLAEYRKGFMVTRFFIEMMRENASNLLLGCVKRIDKSDNYNFSYEFEEGPFFKKENPTPVPYNEITEALVRELERLEGRD